MIRYYGSAAAFAAALFLLAGCATESRPEKTAEADKNACLGVAPPTGSLVRRKEDCGASRAQDEQAKQEMIDAIRSKPGYNPTSVKP
ncbi:MAG TPA: hypothetical protein VIE63_10060 [Ramlibacter sp.]|jgi:uncharacterized membrane protein